MKKYNPLIVFYSGLAVALVCMALSVRAEAKPSLNALIEHNARCLTYAEYTGAYEYIERHEKALRKYMNDYRYSAFIQQTKVHTRIILNDASYNTGSYVQELASSMYNRICSVRM